MLDRRQDFELWDEAILQWCGWKGAKNSDLTSSSYLVLASVPHWLNPAGNH
jgi:hypothetical protein